MKRICLKGLAFPGKVQSWKKGGIAKDGKWQQILDVCGFHTFNSCHIPKFSALSEYTWFSSVQVPSAFSCHPPPFSAASTAKRLVRKCEPVFLKKMTRIHSMGFVFVVWMLIYGLIQRELRRALRSRGGKCPHPDRRMVENPTTRGVLDLFTHVCVTTGCFLGRTIAQIQFWKPELDRVLELLGDPFLYDQYSRRATN